jgi:fibronectin-binding autotransporter adhesin
MAGRWISGIFVSAFVVAAAGIAAPPAAAATSVDCATQDLQQQIDAATEGATLLVKGTCSGNFTIGNPLTIKGDPHATLDGQSIDSVVHITGTPNVRFVDVTITHGAAASGGGILHEGGPLALTRTKVIDNLAFGSEAGGTRGGGIFSSAGAITIASSLLAGNLAVVRSPGESVKGGGIAAFGAPLSIVDSTIRDNRASSHAVASSSSEALVGGGGIFTQNVKVSIVRSRITSNRAIGVGRQTGEAVGGGMEILFGAGLTITQSTISGNVARASNDGSFGSFVSGGGFYSSAPPTITASRITGNTASATGNRAEVLGGGIDIPAKEGIIGDLPTQIVAATISGNTAHATGGSDGTTVTGGGIFFGNPATLSIQRTTIDSNSALGDSFFGAVGTGGGVDAAGPTSLLRSTVSRNVVEVHGFLQAVAEGGGMRLQEAGADDVITNSTVAGNSALTVSRNGTGTSLGGGIDDLLDPHTLDVSFTTVARNAAAADADTAQSAGGGVRVGGAPAALAASILALNKAGSGPNCVGDVTSGGHNVLGPRKGCSLPPQPSDRLTTAPKLGALAANGGPTETIALLAGSPSLNAVPTSACLVPTDQRGVHRPQGPRCDSGAYEQKA